MLKKINSFLAQSSATTSTTKKQRPEVTFNDGKRSSDSVVDTDQLVSLPEPVQSSNTVKIYVSYDIGLYLPSLLMNPTNDYRPL